MTRALLLSLLVVLCISSTVLLVTAGPYVLRFNGEGEREEARFVHIRGKDLRVNGELVTKEEWSKAFPEFQHEHITEPQPWQLAESGLLTVPDAWDWRNISGVNMVSWSRNQHLPQYCGACWAHGSTSALSDRIRIGMKAAWPEISIAPQLFLNCADCGSCGGGFDGCVWAYAHSNGVVEETCLPYQADDFDCTPINTCRVCSPQGCKAQSTYKLWKVGDFGSVSGATRMKAEIYSRGPISCSIDATSKFEAYTGGIFSESVVFPMANHIISLLGFGVENGVEYWIGRNSWGTYWGEQGFFRIKMHHDNLGVEQDCHWGVPIIN